MRAKIITAVLVVLVVVGAAALIKYGNVASAPVQGSTTDPVLGSTTAQLTIQEYGDFQCPACKQLHSVIEQIVKDEAGKVKLVFNDFPLTSVHSHALEAAVAGQCVFNQNQGNGQDKFWQFHDVLYAQQDTWSKLTDPTDQFITYAEQLGVDKDTFSSCLKDQTTLASVEEDMSEGDSSRINSTPTLFVGDQRVVGASDYASLKAIVDKHLE